MDVKFPGEHISGMESPPQTSLQKRVRERMDALGLNAAQASRRAGLSDSFVRDILRGKARSPSAENLRKLAAALETEPDFFWNPATPGNVRPMKAQVVGLPVVSSVKAGNWLEVTIMDADSDHEVIPAARDPRFPRAAQYALRVVGDSMDQEYPDGSYVTCVDFWESGVSIRDGLPVHVERRRAGGQLVEITIKFIETIDGRQYLAPRSNNPAWKPIPIEGDEDTEVIIKGLVTGSWKPTVF